MYQQYQGSFFQHVSIVAESQYAIEFKTRYDDCDQNPKERIQLNGVQKIEEIVEHGITINQIRVGGDQGLLKYEWINKMCGKKPSVIVYIVEMVPAQIQSMYAKYQDAKRILSSKGHNNQSKMLTKVIVLLFSKAGVGPDVDAATAQIKQTMELDSKNIFSLPQTQDAIYLNIQYATNYYDERYKKYKKNISKQSDLLANEKNLTLHFKMAVIDELSSRIDKAKKHYESAYSECENLMTFHRMHANKTIIPNNLESIDSNYDIILKVEELRYIADIIKIRLLILLIQDKKHQEAIQQFIIHYKKYKESVDYFDPIFQFEEYKWRTELFKVFITEMQKESLNKSAFIDTNLFNLIIGCVVYGHERFLLFQGFKNIESPQHPDFSIIKKPPLYFGRQNYVIQGQQRVSYNEQKLIITRMVKNDRLFQENKEIEQNMLSENLAFLNMCEELFPTMSERQKIIISFRRLYNCALSRDFEQYSLIAEEILPKLANFKMSDVKIYVLETYESFLKSSHEYSKLLNVNLELLLLKEETFKEKEDRGIEIKKCVEMLEKNDDQMIYIDKENNAFRIEIEYNQNKIKAFEKSTATFKFTSLIPSLQIYKKVVINLNDSTQIIEFDINLSNNISVFEKKIELTANNLKLKHLSIENIVVSHELQSSSGKKFSLNFFVPANTINYKYHTQLLIEKPHEPSIEISFKRKDFIYLNELFQLQVCASYLEGTSDDLILQNPQLNFSECIAIKDKHQIITIDNSENQVYQLNGQQKTPIKNTHVIPLNFEFGDQLFSKFLLRINKYQIEEIKFQAQIKYSIFNKKTNVVEPRQIQKILDLKVQLPFIITAKWSVSNNQQQNQESKRKNASLNNYAVLPVNQMCNLQIKVCSQMDSVCIHSLKINVNEQGHNFKLIRDVQFQKKKLIKNESIAVSQFIQTLKQSNNVRYGQISIQFNSQDDYSEAQELNTFSADLLNVVIEQRQLRVEVDYPEVAKIGEFFDMVVKITNLQNRALDLKVLLNERDSKKFMIAGKVITRELVDAQKTVEVQYKLLPTDIGRFRLPGFQIEQKFEETYSTIYDSQCLKHIVILPLVS